MSNTITLNGREYAVDYGSEAYQRASIPLLRRQSDQGDRPGSQSINPEGPWRRTFESWHRGEGQTHADREASDPARFNDSDGVDCWDKYTLRLLPRTMQAYVATSSISATLVVGNRLYVADGPNLLFTTNLFSWTTVTGLSGGLINRLASDGQTVWIATGGTLLQMDNAGTAASAHGSHLAAGVWYVKGRLIISSSDRRTLSNVLNALDKTDLAVLPAGRWVDVTEGNGFIYAASSSQSNAALAGTGEGTIHRIGIKTDGTGLDVPIIAAKLPSGEDALSVFGYLGFVLIGTSNGVRFSAENGDGSLTLGSLRLTQNHSASQGASAFTAEDRFVYYTQSAFDGSKAGLTRLDLSEFIAPLTPAGAADLATPVGTIDPSSNTTVSSCGTYARTQFFTITGSFPGGPGGLWIAESAVTTGSLSTGLIDYGLSESKVPLFVDIQTAPLQNGTSVAVAVKFDGELNFTQVGTHNVIGSSAYSVDISSHVIDPEDNSVRDCRTFEVRVTLGSNGSSSTPVINRITLRAYPITSRGEIIQLPVLLGESVDHNGLVVNRDVSAEIATFRSLLSSKRLVTLTEGDTSTQVYVEDFSFRADSRDEDGTDLRGTMVLRLKSFA